MIKIVDEKDFIRTLKKYSFNNVQNNYKER